MLVCLAIISCTSDQPLAPRPLLHPRFLAGGTNGVKTFQPGSSNDTVGPINLDTFPYPTLVEVQTGGSITERYASSSVFPGLVDSLTGGVYGVSGHWENNTCRATVIFKTAWDSPGGFCVAPNVTFLADTFMVIHGHGWLSWSGGFPSFGAPTPLTIDNGYGHVCGPGSDPCYSYSGTVTVSVARVPADLVVSSSQGSGTNPGDSVTVTATTSVTTVHGITVPFTIQKWRWVPDTLQDTTQAGQACAPPSGSPNPASCKFAPTTSGVVYVDAVVNGIPETKPVRVRVVNCLTQDSILNDPKVRAGLQTALAASHPDSAAWLRQEHAGIIWRAPDGSYYTQDATASGATGCRSGVENVVPTIENSTPVAIYHTHPSRTHDDVYGCPDDEAGEHYAQTLNDPYPTRTADHFINGGGSDFDWNGATGQGRVIYIIDNDGQAVRLDPGVSPGQRPWNQKKWLWKGGSCNW